ncbi:hypothetical protein KAI32_03345 [Candidatus Pacearchaeota archaeon]|nr:hypothetical protein [Candidatus Pacearchaeota archaeon]
MDIETILRFQQQQTMILERQTNFSRILMLATIVLAIGAFLQVIIQLINIPTSTYNNIATILGFWGGIMLFVPMIFFLGLMGIIIYLIILTIRNR